MILTHDLFVVPPFKFRRMLVELHLPMVDVAGSSPVGPTLWGRSSMVERERFTDPCRRFF